jgi:hypothetical protein
MFEQLCDELPWTQRLPRSGECATKKSGTLHWLCAGRLRRGYLRERVTLGYAVTVHSAQGVTTDTAHAVLSEGATRAMAYVALSRGRDSNHVYICTLDSAEAEHDHSHPAVGRAHHQLRRGTNTQRRTTYAPSLPTMRAPRPCTYRLNTPSVMYCLTSSTNSWTATTDASPRAAMPGKTTRPPPGLSKPLTNAWLLSSMPPGAAST